MASSQRERFLSHSLWPSLENSRARAVELLKETSDETTDSLQFAISVLELSLQRRDETSEFEVTTPMLDRVVSALGSLEQHLTQQSEILSSDNLISYTNVLIEAFAGWPALRPKRFLSGIDSALESFTRSVDAEVSDLENTLSETKAQITKVSESQTALDGRLDAETQRVNEALATFTVESSNKFQQFLDETSEGLVQKQEEFQKKLDAFDEGAARELRKMTELERRARDTVSSTAAIVTGADYAEYAKRRNKVAVVYDIVALIIGASGVGIVAWHVLTNDPRIDANVGLAIARLAIAGTAVGLAYTIASKASQFRKEAHSAKQIDLALHNVHSFISTQPHDVQEEVLLRMAERVFIEENLDDQPRERLLERLRKTRISRTDISEDESDPQKPA